ncbi:hypothetical protein [Micromonospora aurantiaca]|uniref:Uncharacterized protein n=1 Tax=Micromonospora aurantiaca (nom. illeg.) TaxID=47850 RepID=A0A6N3JV24_9ACTN|nr:hypothetical protein [Micromonospora aurantiaca]AXH88759.1 hypothetical protein DVH21_01800 [Micromonospora aurantiaca]
MTKVAPVEVVYQQLPGPTDEPISPALLAEVTGMGYSTVTRHLRALASAGRADKVDPTERGAPVLWFRTDADAASTPQTPARQEPVRPTAAAQPDGPGQHPQSRAGDPADARPVTEPQALDPQPAPEASAENRGSAEAGEPAGPAVELPSPPDQPDPDDVVADLVDAIRADLGTADGPVPPVPLTGDDPRPVSATPVSGGVAEVAEWMQSARPVSPAPVDVVAPPPDRLTEAEARALTAEIRARVTDLLPLIKTAFQRRADLALGYPSWAAYCDAELRGLRMPLEERQAATAALHAEGMSTRAIAGALGTSDATVRRDLRDAGATDDAPERVVGLDGKRYASTRPTTAAEADDLASADAGGEGLSSSSPVDTSAAPAAPVGAGAAGVSPQVDTAAEGSHDPAPADEVDSAAGETRPSTGAASALSPADPAGEGATPDPYIADPAQRAAWVADNAPGYVRVIDGEATETAVDPHDPGPVPEPPALAPGLADLIAAHLDDLTLSTDALAGQLLAAGPHAGNYLRRLRDHRHQVDQLIRRLEDVDG